MAGATQLPAETQKAIKEAVEAHRIAVVDDIRKAVADAMTNVVQYGENVGLRASGGQLMCAEQGGPTEENKTFTLTSRKNVGPWETFKVERGS